MLSPWESPAYQNAEVVNADTVQLGENSTLYKKSVSLQ